ACAVGGALLCVAKPGERGARLLGVALAAVVTACVTYPFLRDQLATAVLREAGSPIALSPYEVLGDVFPASLRRALDLPAFWLIFLVVELPAIYLTGAVALALLIVRGGGDRATRPDAL